MGKASRHDAVNSQGKEGGPNKNKGKARLALHA